MADAGHITTCSLDESSVQWFVVFSALTFQNHNLNVVRCTASQTFEASPYFLLGIHFFAWHLLSIIATTKIQLCRDMIP